MTVRVLPREEWDRLEGRGPAPLLARVPEALTSVVVVERDGKIVATLGLMPFLHFEGLWIDPAHRNPGVARGLLRGALDVAGGAWVVAGSADDRMAGILTKLRATKIEAEFWILNGGGA